MSGQARLSALEADMLVLGKALRWGPEEIRRLPIRRRRKLASVMIQAQRSSAPADSAPPAFKPRARKR